MGDNRKQQGSDSRSDKRKSQQEQSGTSRQQGGGETMRTPSPNPGQQHVDYRRAPDDNKQAGRDNNDR